MWYCGSLRKIVSLKKEHFSIWISNLCLKELLTLQSDQAGNHNTLSYSTEWWNGGMVEWQDILRHRKTESPKTLDALLCKTKVSQMELQILWNSRRKSGRKHSIFYSSDDETSVNYWPTCFQKKLWLSIQIYFNLAVKFYVFWVVW